MGRKVKAVIPGGASTPMLTGDQLDVPMAFETLAGRGLGAGHGAVIVMDETTDMVEVTRRITSFFVHESCGELHALPDRRQAHAGAAGSPGQRPGPARRSGRSWSS